ncbi:MAG: glycosyltransferase, partial [Actinomycetota bacterium]|nr:glycosyltransferase [Actinomycetota bacterium]
VREVASELPFAEVVIAQNPARRTSAGLNIGLGHARGDYVARVDARSRIPTTYVRQCLQRLAHQPEIGVVGGMQVAQARTGGAVEAGIARALRNRWTTGLSRYRRGSSSGPSDTVWMGFFRTEELRARQGWDAAVALNEDYELNHRYRLDGRVVWFDASLRSGYLPRRTLAELARQHFRFGRVKGMSWARGQRPAPRQLLLVVAPLAGAIVLRSLLARSGPWSAVAVPASLLALDRLQGDDDEATPLIRLAASAATATIGLSWWSGVAAGAAGELAHVRHRHG